MLQVSGNMQVKESSRKKAGRSPLQSVCSGFFPAVFLLLSLMG